MLIILLAERGGGDNGPCEGELIGVCLAGTDNGDGDGGSGLALKHEADYGEGKLAGRLLADGFDHIAVGEMLLVGGRAGQDVDHSGVSEAF